MAKIGFIGLGHMGYPMAANLIKGKHSLKVFDIDHEAVSNLLKLGAVGTKSVAEAADDSDFVITMLQTSEQVSKSCLGEKGIFSHLAKDAVYIDCSSIAIMTSQTLHREASELGLMMLDAPVSGGVKGALAKTLTFMVGGTPEVFAKAKSILQDMGKNIIHAGKGGSGQATKICNNMILGVSMIAVSEAFTLAEKLGLEPRKFFQISSQASGECWAMTHYCPVPEIIPDVPANYDYQPGFTTKMMLKDLKLSQDAARHVGLNTQLGLLATKIYQDFFDEGQGEIDFSGIIKTLQKK